MRFVAFLNPTRFLLDWMTIVLTKWKGAWQIDGRQPLQHTPSSEQNNFPGSDISLGFDQFDSIEKSTHRTVTDPPNFLWRAGKSKDMPKRKRDVIPDDNGSDSTEDQALRIRRSRFKARLDQGQKSLVAALKLARGFERQKLGRRQKQSASNGQALLKIKEEIILLKSLNLSETTEKYLFKQLVRTKRIRESPVFISLYGEDPEINGPKPGAEANVMARLFSSNPVKEVVSGIMKGIRHVLGIEGDQAAAKSGSPPLAVPPGMEAQRAEDQGDESSFRGFSELMSDQESANEGQNLRPSTEHHTQAKYSSHDEDDGVAYQDRLATASDESNSGFELASEQSDSEFSLADPSNHVRRSISPSLSSSPTPRHQKALLTVSKPTDTSFLPSLSYTGYYSGGSSDASDLDEPPTNVLQAQRKNRRGQRERQKIAEKKYGTKAKHLQKANAGGRDAGWDAKRGATGGMPSSSRYGRYERGRRTGVSSKDGGVSASGANSEAVRDRRTVKRIDVPKTVTGTTHPSWEAARKRKEMGRSVTDKYVGTRITFD